MIDDEVKEALVNLMSVCARKGIPIAGGMDSSSGIYSFKNQIGFNSDGGKSLEAIIKVRGDVNKFLIEMSKNEHSSSDLNSFSSGKEMASLENKDHALVYLKTNPQVTKTKH